MHEQDLLKINIIVDNESWVLKYAEKLKEWCLERGFSTILCRKHKEISPADLSFFLGCIQIATTKTLEKSGLNLVVHESDLPKGRGFSPMSWQILEGQSSIVVCLVEATDGEVDSGRIIDKSLIELSGHELSEEWRHLQGEETVRICQAFLDRYPDVYGEEQKLKPTYYKRRHPSDSELDINKSIKEQFNLLRVVDNVNYPAFFNYQGHRYELAIRKFDNVGITSNYVFATTKSWQIEPFKKISDQLPGQWTLITSKDDLTIDLIETINPRYIFFGHWSWIVNENILKKTECVCFHMTDVPFGRGGSPLQNLISRGLSETKLTALKMIKEVDAGPIYDKKSLSLSGTAKDIFERMTPIMFEMMKTIIQLEPEPFPQNGEPVYFERRTPEMSKLPEEGDIERLYDHIRMLDVDTYPSAYIEHGKFRLKLRKAKQSSINCITAEAVITVVEPREDDD